MSYKQKTIDYLKNLNSENENVVDFLADRCMALEDQIVGILHPEFGSVYGPDGEATKARNEAIEAASNILNEKAAEVLYEGKNVSLATHMSLIFRDIANQILALKN